MIIGGGLIANNFERYRDSRDTIIFASGVSNSGETNVDSFNREKKLLLETIKAHADKRIVYFSSCDVIYIDKGVNVSYYEHKLHMEQLIKNNCLQYSIFRLPQVIGNSSNTNSLINYLINAIKADEKISIWSNAYKNLITVEDVYLISNYILENGMCDNQVINIINNNYYSIIEIVSTLEGLLNKKCDYELKEKGYKPNYNSDICEDAVNELGDMFQKNYLTDSLFNTLRNQVC